MKLPKTITDTLSVRLSLTVICGVALLLSVSLAVMFLFSRQALRKEALYDAEQTLEGTVQHIDNILLSVEQSAGNIYVDLIRHLDEPDRMYTYSRRLVECNPNIEGCAIVFKPDYYPGRKLFMAYFHRKGLASMKDGTSELVASEEFASRPYTEQTWYKEPITTGRACWTEPLKNNDTEEEALISFCLPIYGRDKQQPVGVLVVDLSIGLLSQIVHAARISPNSYCTLLGRDGSFIVHPDPEKLSHQTVFMQTENGANPTAREAAEAMVSGETGYKTFQLNGQDWCVFYKPFLRTKVTGRTMEELKWSVGVVYPEDDIFGSYNRLLFYVIVITVIVLLLFFGLCYMVTHRQLHPLYLLTYSAQRIADGHYDESIPDTKRGDEVGLLQDHFQQMQRSLSAHISELKQMSATLQERSEVLRKAYAQAQEADRMKMSFLHNMTNQMVAPSEAISKSVNTFCHHYYDISQQEADQEVSVIQQQSKAIIDLLNQMIFAAENGSEDRKEVSHE